MSELHDKILEYVDYGYHCSQTMMQLTLDLRRQEEPFTIRALGGFGGGMACQRTCGALLGSVAAISSYFPRDPGQPEPNEYKVLVKEMVEWFETTFGSIECRDLVEFDRPKIRAHCPGMMEQTFHQLTKILEAHGMNPAG